MKIKDHTSTSTKFNYTVIVDEKEILDAKNAVVKELTKNLKVDGFRPGKIPQAVAEKNLDSQTVQADTINKALDSTYSKSLEEKNLIPVGQPHLTVTKFVPYTVLEYKIELEVIGKLKIADYTKFGFKLEAIPVSEKQLNETVEELRTRSATYTKVDRGAKDKDRLLIDFNGKDFKTNDALETASAKDYYLILGSKSFIPGFEEKLVGQKLGKVKPFDITFPKDYHDKDFKSRKVTFSVTIKAIEEPTLDKLDDKFAAKMGPFQSLEQLKSQLSIELRRENDQTSRRNLESKILNKLAETTTAQIPDSLIKSEMQTIQEFDQQNATNSGMTWTEFLKAQKLSETSYKSKLKPAAQRRIKSGLALVEIAKQSDITVTKVELDEQIAELKKQYSDPAVRAQLDQESVRNDLTKRILTQKVLDHIRSSN